MEKKRGNQVMAIAALFIAVIGLSLGFAAFSNTLTISSGATVNPSESNFDIDFTNANSTTGLPSGATLPYVTGGVPTASITNPAGLTVTNGTMTNSGEGSPLVSGLSAEFTEPGQSVTYNFYTMNTGHLVGYLREINFAGSISCSASEVTSSRTPATSGLVDEACKDMRIAITVDGTATQTYSNKGPNTTADANYHNAGTTAITGHSIATGAFHTVAVTIAYDKDTSVNNEAGNTVDGPVTVTFPSIRLVYRSVEGSNS